MTYDVFGKKTGTPGITRVVNNMPYAVAMAAINTQSRPRIVKQKKKGYARFYDWEWMALCRHRD